MAASSIIKVVALADMNRLVSGMRKGSEAVKGFEKTGLSSFKKFAKGAALAGAALAVGALVKASKAAVEDSKSQALLAKSMQNTVNATSSQIAESEKFIGVLQRKTAIVDDQLRPAYATLVRSTGDVTQAQSLLTLASDISAGTGKDLGMVTQALGKAYNGQYASLNKLIPGIAKAEDPMKQLRKQFGGMAEAAANNDPFAKMKIMFDDLAETVGAVLIPVMNSLLNAIQPLIDTLAPIITDLVGKLAPILISIIEPLSKFIGDLMKDLMPLITVILDLVGIFMKLLSPILGFVGKLLGKLASALTKLLEPLLPIVDEFMPILVSLFDLMSASIDPLLDMIEYLAELLGQALADELKNQIPVMKQVMNVIKNLTAVYVRMGDVIERVLGGLRKFTGGKMKELPLTGDMQNDLRGDKANFYGYGAKKPGGKNPQSPGTKKPGETVQKVLETAIKTLQEKLDAAKQIINDTVAKFRDSVDTAFGLVQRGSGFVFRADRYIRELKRMKAATADFNDNLKKLRDMGGKAANPLLEQILSKTPEEAAAIMRSFTASPEMFAEAIKTTSELAATGGLVGAQASAMAGNQTQAQMLNELKLLRADLAKGKNTYNIKSTMSATEIVNSIKAWEKSMGKKVLVG